MSFNNQLIEIAYQQRLGEATLPESGITEGALQIEADGTHETSDATAVGLAIPKEPPPKRARHISLSFGDSLASFANNHPVILII